MTAVLGLIAAVGTTPAAFAHSQNYWTGHSDGIQQAFDDYRNGNSYDASCPTRDDGSQHTSNYCAGYGDGYSAGWMSAYYNHSPRQQVRQEIGQNSEVNIKGNNNRVVVNQQANNGVNQPVSGYPIYSNDGSDGSSGHHSSSSSSNGGQSNPRCVLLCANIRVN
jgi:hypothetical protein